MFGFGLPFEEDDSFEPVPPTPGFRGFFFAFIQAFPWFAAFFAVASIFRYFEGKLRPLDIGIQGCVLLLFSTYCVLSEQQLRFRNRRLPNKLVRELQSTPFPLSSVFENSLSRYFPNHFGFSCVTSSVLENWSHSEIAFHFKRKELRSDVEKSFDGVGTAFIAFAFVLISILGSVFILTKHGLIIGACLSSLLLLLALFVCIGLKTRVDIQTDRKCLESGHFHPEVIKSYLQKLQDRPTDFAAGFAPIRRAMAKYRYEKFLQLLNS